jgi:hypothetical protein
VRLIKMFGLASIAVIVAMAFVGASSAMATNTVLCKANELVCAAPNVYTGHVEALSTHALLKASGIEILCKHSLILGEALGLANPLIIHVSELTFKECDGTVNVLDKTGLIKVLKTAPNLASGTAEGFEVLAERFGVHCVYGGVAEGAHGLGSASATSEASIVAKEIELKKLAGGFFCAGTSRWTATYTVKLPLPIYIAE